MIGSILKRAAILLPAILVCAAAGAAEIGADDRANSLANDRADNLADNYADNYLADNYAGNYLAVHTQGDDNVIALEQIGQLNSLNLLIQAQNVGVSMLQQGNQNLIAGVNGAPAFVMTGHHSVVDIVQIGSNNQVFGMQLSANSVMSVTQHGSNNVATIIQR